MSEDENQVMSHRATILIGFGAFGLDVLRRLLASTAPRGVLRWEQSQGGARTSERYLQNLALLWLKDRIHLDSHEVDEESTREGSSFEMMRDLYRQIHEVKSVSTPEHDLAEAMSEAAEKLLSAASRAYREEASPLGLDVIVVAQPTGPEVIGFLDRIFALGMDRLANNANLERAVQGSEALNFIEILDFENYWDRSAHGRRIRQALHNSVGYWQKRRQRQKMAFGRCYLVDGRTQDGIRDARHRIDEINLFLEFLLFEGQRGKIQRLYQPRGSREMPIATFGIRLMERSAGLLSRLAAARFGNGWLDYLAGTQSPTFHDEPLEFHRKLGPYRPDKLEELLGGQELKGYLRDRMQALEEELAALEPARDDWAELVRQRYEATATELENELAARIRERMRDISQNHLAELAADLRAGVNADLHHPRQPVPLGAVIRAIDAALEEFDEVPAVPAPASGAAAEALDSLARLHSDFRSFNVQRVNVDALPKWWLLWAFVLAAGLTPIAIELLEDLPKPDPLSWWDLPYQLSQSPWVQSPITLGLLIFLTAWTLGRRAFQSRLAARVHRARRFFSDQARGRFANRLRACLKPDGGALFQPMSHFLDRMLRDMVLSVRSEVSRELGQVGQRLRERRREMIWLRGQLREFLKMHQPMDGMQQSRDGTGIRHAVERREDFERMLKSNPPGPERFRSMQASRNPFTGWDQRYSDVFLSPLRFIDDLSTVYKDPFQVELAQPGEGPEQATRKREFLAFLKRHGGFDLAFTWMAQEGLPNDQRYCLLPSVWRFLPGVLQALADLRMTEKNVLVGRDVARAYLLRVQTGVDPACLLEVE